MSGGPTVVKLLPLLSVPVMFVLEPPDGLAICTVLIWRLAALFRKAE